MEDKLPDTAMSSFIVVAGLLGIKTDEGQICRSYVLEHGRLDEISMVRIAREMGVRAGIFSYEEKQGIPAIPIPAIAVLKNGEYVVVMKQTSHKITCYSPVKESLFYMSMSDFQENWARRLLLFAKEWSEKKDKLDLAWILAVIKKYKKGFATVIGFSVLLQIFGLITPLFMQTIINKVLVQHSIGTLNILAGGMLCLCVFRAWISGLRRFLLNHYVSKVDVGLSAKLFYHLLRLPISFFCSYKIGEIATRMREVGNIRRFIVGSAFTVLLDTVFSMLYMIILFVYNVKLACITLVSLLLFILLNLILTPMLQCRLKEKFKQESSKQAFLVETLTGIETIKTMGIESRFMQEWDQRLTRQIRKVFSIDTIDNIGNNAARTIQQLSMIAILWFGVNEIMEKNFTVGELIAFQMYTGYVISPILRLVSLWQNYHQAKVSLEYLNDIAKEEPEKIFSSQHTTLPELQGEIIFDKVDFIYKGSTRKSLNCINLRIPAGSSLGIVGRSGSGKSTLAKLLQRFYLPTRGTMYIDGVDISKVEPAWLRQKIGVVLQETCLFKGTLWENIALPKLDAKKEMILEAARIAGADDFIKDMPQKYATMVGERGAGLSGGQKQRVAIARALVTNPRIMIFDEATSALDTEAEEYLKTNLSEIRQNRTLIMIAHRLTTVRNCNKIIYMDQGGVIESGTHEQLMEQKGAYYELYMKQA